MLCKQRKLVRRVNMCNTKETLTEGLECVTKNLKKEGWLRLNRLKELRKEKKLTQQEVAKKIGVSYRTLQNWENGVNTIKPDKVQEFADYFGVSASYLLGYGYKKQETKSVEKLENVYVEFLGNIDAISDIDLEDLKEFSNRLYVMAIAEKTRRYHADISFAKIQEYKNKKEKRGD